MPNTGNPTQDHNPFIGSDGLTLADVIDRLEHNTELAPPRRRDLTSAVHRLAVLLDRDPVMLPANLTALKPGIARLHPVQVGITRKTLQNIQSNVLAALRHQAKNSTNSSSTAAASRRAISISLAA